MAFVEAMAAGLPAIGGPRRGRPRGHRRRRPRPGPRPARGPRGAGAARSTACSPTRTALAELGRQARDTVARSFTWARCGEATVGGVRAGAARMTAPTSSCCRWEPRAACASPTRPSPPCCASAGASVDGGGRADRGDGPAAAVLPGDRPGGDRGGGAARRRPRLERHDPRAVVAATTGVAMLAPLGDRPYAVRFDSPVRAQPPGPPQRDPARARAAAHAGRAAAAAAQPRRRSRRARGQRAQRRRPDADRPLGPRRSARTRRRRVHARPEGQGARRARRGVGAGGRPRRPPARLRHRPRPRARLPGPLRHPRARGARMARVGRRATSSAPPCGRRTST